MRTILSILFITACAWTSHAQTTVTLSYPDYMRKVRENNLAYAAEKLNISIASAGVTASKVFNDPNLSLSYFNNENRTLQMGEGVEVELSKTFTFGKRSANIALAKSEKELSEALLADFFHNLRADTHADNAVMQRLLEGAGFVRCGIIYTDDGMPRLAYQKYAVGQPASGREASL